MDRHARHVRLLSLAAFALAVLVSGCTAAAGQTPTPAVGTPPTDGITVEGVGRVTGTPDTLRAVLGVESSAATVQEALDAANAAAAAVLEALREAGVAQEDLQTRDLSVQPRYEQPTPEAPPEITGYTVRNLVEARLRDLDRVGEVLQAALRAGGDDARLQGVSFALEDNEALLTDARAAAFADARAKAEQYARLADAQLGRLVRVTETAGVLPPPVPLADRAGTEAAAAVPIAPGTEEVSVRVTAVWELS